MRTVTRFQSKDGKDFSLESECIQHEKIILFGEWYDKHVLYGRYEGSSIGLEEVVEWLQKYRLQVLELLKNGE